MFKNQNTQSNPHCARGKNELCSVFLLHILITSSDQNIAWRKAPEYSEKKSEKQHGVTFYLLYERELRAAVQELRKTRWPSKIVDMQTYRLPHSSIGIVKLALELGREKGAFWSNSFCYQVCVVQALSPQTPHSPISGSRYIKSASRASANNLLSTANQKVTSAEIMPKANSR